jgi:hypothetical protein
MFYESGPLALMPPWDAAVYFASPEVEVAATAVDFQPLLAGDPNRVWINFCVVGATRPVLFSNTDAQSVLFGIPELTPPADNAASRTVDLRGYGPLVQGPWFFSGDTVAGVVVFVTTLTMNKWPERRDLQLPPIKVPKCPTFLDTTPPPASR